MSYSVDNIISVNLYLTAAGLGYGDFSSAFTLAEKSDLKAERTFDENTFRDYSGVTEVANDFPTESHIYLIASRWFAQVPKPKAITVWMREEGEAILDSVNKSANAAWRYHYFLKSADLEDSEIISLGDWADNLERPLWFTLTDEDITDSNSTDDLASVMSNKGNRHVFIGYKPASAVALDPSQEYAMVQLAAAFNKFRPTGIDTAITGEYQVLTGVTGDSLQGDQYKALKAKNVVFFTQIELAGQIDNSRVINSKSMSSYGEFIDDVINLDVLKNHLQVDGYNYIANSGTKRKLTPRGYAGLLDALTTTCKRFYDNGVLGEGSYTNSETGETVTAEYGFVIQAAPEDVLAMDSTQRKKRQFPDTKILVILARAGHVAEINVFVE